MPEGCLFLDLFWFRCRVAFMSAGTIWTIRNIDPQDGDLDFHTAPEVSFSGGGS